MIIKSKCIVGFRVSFILKRFLWKIVGVFENRCWYVSSEKLFL